MPYRTVMLAAVMLAVALPAFAQQKKKRKTRDTVVREDRQQFQDSDYWTYNDLDKGLAAAKKTGKPLLVVFR